MCAMVTQSFLGHYLSSILSDLILLMVDAECCAWFVHILGVVDGTACEII